MEMSDIERQVLQQNHVDILRNLKLDSDILGSLFEKGILTEHMVQVIQVGNSSLLKQKTYLNSNFFIANIL